jgi:Domain of unknown function (DUF222)
MASLKHMFDQLTSSSPDSDGVQATAGRPLAELESEICTLAGHLAAATCRFLVLLAEFDAREGWASWDMPSCAAWLSWKCQLGSGTAREHVRVARALTTLPVIRGEFAAGRFSYAKVRALTRIATPDSEADLAEMAGPMTANQLERFARAHRTVTTAMGEQAQLDRRLRWRFEDDGSLSLSVHLPPEDGAAVLTALRAATADRVSAETPAQPTSTSLADALVEMAESYIAGKTRDVQNPDIYQVIVHATPDALVPGPPAATPAQPSRCHIEDGPAISRAALQQIACDAVLSWMSHDKHGNVLDVGRRRREPPPALRRALRERDKCRCRFPGCHRRATQAHHIRWWLYGGITSLGNLISLCKYHHRLIHQHGYSIGTTPVGSFTFFRPDGKRIPDSPPLPEPAGPLSGEHDAEITPETIVPPWYGERLNLDYAIAVLFGNQQARREAVLAA